MEYRIEALTKEKAGYIGERLFASGRTQRRSRRAHLLRTLQNDSLIHKEQTNRSLRI